MRRIAGTFVLAWFLAAVSAPTVRADVATYTTTLTGRTAATGVATLVVDTVTLEANWTLVFTDLSSPQTGVHFHNAPVGENGPIVFTLPLGSPVDGTWSMSQAEYDMLTGGNIYINVHSVNTPAGEIRGQMALAGVVSDGKLAFGELKALYR